MKRFISILLMFALLIQAGSQLWMLLLFECNRDYIARNLCVNRFESIPVCKGSCYLEKQLQQEQQQQQKLPELKNKEITLFFGYTIVIAIVHKDPQSPCRNILYTSCHSAAPLIHTPFSGLPLLAFNSEKQNC